MTNGSDKIPPELTAQLEGPWREGLEQHTNEVRRTLLISTGFYEKLAALDAGSIAIAASAGGVIVAKFGTPTPELRSVSHWLVWIIVALWVSLLSGVGHNFGAVGIAQLEAAYSEQEFIRRLMRDSLKFAESFYPNFDHPTIEHVLSLAEKKPLEIQQRNVRLNRILQGISKYLGYVSVAAFIAAYTLVLICAKRLWL